MLIVDSADPEFFIAHADIALIQRLPTDDTTLHDELSPFDAVVDLFRTLPKATIAVIEGIAAVAASEFAMAFDMRFAALGKARLAQPEVAVGIIPGGGGTQRLPRLVGRARALEVILGCDGHRRGDRRSLGLCQSRAARRTSCGAFVATLAARIASFPRDVIAARQARGRRRGGRSRDRAAHRGPAVSRNPRAAGRRERMQAILDAGGQTREVEIGELSLQHLSSTPE